MHGALAVSPELSAPNCQWRSLKGGKEAGKEEHDLFESMFGIPAVTSRTPWYTSWCLSPGSVCVALSPK